MAAKKGNHNEAQFSVTQANLDRKGKTNKKLISKKGENIKT